MQAEDGQGLFGKTLDWIQPVPEPDEREWITAAILAVSGRFLTVAETYSLAKEWRAMPKILDEMKNQGVQQGRGEGLQQMARAMLAVGDFVEKIVSVTGLPRKRGSPEGALTRKNAPLQVLTFPRVLDSEVWFV